MKELYIIWGIIVVFIMMSANAKGVPIFDGSGISYSGGGYGGGYGYGRGWGDFGGGGGFHK